jgi:hypothetical protein
MNRHQQLANYILKHPNEVGKVVDFDPDVDRLLQFDFTANNKALSPLDIAVTAKFSAWVNQQLLQNHCRYGIGGYMEHRTWIYGRQPAHRFMLHYKAPFIAFKTMITLAITAQPLFYNTTWMA